MQLVFWQLDGEFFIHLYVKRKNAENYTLACLAFHNYLRLTEMHYIARVDS